LAGEPNLLDETNVTASGSMASVADEGTGWNPTDIEQDAMDTVILHFLRSPKLE
jgi:hypothetical protein